MDLWQMFVLVFELSRGLLSEALPAVTFQLECGLISGNVIGNILRSYLAP